MRPKPFWLLFSLSVLLIFLTQKSIYADESQTVKSKPFCDYLADLKHSCQNFAWIYFGEDPKNSCEALSK